MDVEQTSRGGSGAWSKKRKTPPKGTEHSKRKRHRRVRAADVSAADDLDGGATPNLAVEMNCDDEAGTCMDAQENGGAEEPMRDDANVDTKERVEDDEMMADLANGQENGEERHGKGETTDEHAQDDGPMQPKGSFDSDALPETEADDEGGETEGGRGGGDVYAQEEQEETEKESNEMRTRPLAPCDETPSGSGSNGTTAPERAMSTSGLLDRVLGLGQTPKLYYCQDHDAPDIRGVCTLIVAKDEEQARAYLDAKLVANGLRSHREHAYVVARLPIYRECCFFIGAIFRERLEEQIGKEDTLMLDRIKPKDLQRLKVYYGFTDSHHVRSGYVAAAQTEDGARSILVQNASATTANDHIGLYGAPDHVKDVHLCELRMAIGTIVSATF